MCTNFRVFIHSLAFSIRSASSSEYLPDVSLLYSTLDKWASNLAVNILVLSSESKYNTAKSCFNKSTAQFNSIIDFPCFASAANMNNSPFSIVAYSLSVGNLNGIPENPLPCLDFISSQQSSTTSAYFGMSLFVENSTITSSMIE